MIRYVEYSIGKPVQMSRNDKEKLTNVTYDVLIIIEAKHQVTRNSTKTTFLKWIVLQA